VAKVENGVFRQLKELLTRYNPVWWEFGPREAIEPGGLELPLFALLGIPSITMDLGELARKQWWRRGRIDEKRLARLNGQIQAEWRKIADKLVQCAGEHLQAFQSSLVREARQVYEGVVEAFKQQNRDRLERARALIGSEKQPDRSELQHGQQARIAEIKARISDLARLAGRLESITRNMHRGSPTSH
jgi:DNA anti-recombination protein RmuC